MQIFQQIRMTVVFYFIFYFRFLVISDGPIVRPAPSALMRMHQNIISVDDLEELQGWY